MLRINTLGRLYVERDGRRLAGAAAQPRRLALLAVLAAAGQKGVTRDRMLALLWPDTEEERARKGLNQAVYALRQELGSDDAIAGTRDLRLDPEIVRADVVEFRGALARGDLDAAVHAYHGPFLDGFHLADAPDFERWLETERTGIARDHATALDRLARRATEAGDHPAAAEWWRRRASYDPLDSATAVRLMEALVRAGDPAGAISHARIYEVLIAQELDLPPDREVVQLATRIRKEMEAGAARAPAPDRPVAAAPPVATPASPSVAAAARPVPATVAAAATVAAPGAPPASPPPGAGESPPEFGLYTPPAPPSTNGASGEHGNGSVPDVHAASDRDPEAVIAMAAAWRPTAPDLVAVAPDAPAAELATMSMGVVSPPSTTPVGADRPVAPVRPTPSRTWSDGPESAVPSRTSAPATRRLGAGGAALAGATASALLAVALTGWSPSAEPLRLGATRKATFEAGLEVDPALSPDGKVLAYAAGPEGAMRLYVRQLDGGRPVAVTSADLPGDHRRPRWSPDGTRLLFQSGRAIWLVPALGGTPRVVVDPPVDARAYALYPSWSPDGARLAWIQGDTILVRAVSGGAASAIGVLEAGHSLAWSPDGRWLAAVSGNYGFLYGAAESEFGWTSIGNRAPSSVWVIPADGRPGDGRAVRVTDARHLSTSPEWLGDGQLLFVSDADGTRDVYLSRLGRDGKPAERPVRLTAGTGALSISASPQGREIAFSVLAQRANVWALPIPDGGPVGTAAATPITTGTQVVEGVDVSPDGRWLVFDTDVAGNQDIWRAPTDGSLRAEPVVDGPDDDFQPTFSPDGQTLAFYRFREGLRRTHLVSSAGGTPKQLLPDSPSEEQRPVWRGDGRAIVFSRFESRTWQILSTTRTGSEWAAPRRVTRDRGWNPRWSPDGARLAYLSYDGVRVAPMLGDTAGAARVVFASRDSSLAGVAPVAIRWSVEGRALYVKAFDATGQASLWTVPADGGAARLLVRFDEPLRPARRPEFATDGRRFFFTFAQSESDVWVVRVE